MKLINLPGLPIPTYLQIDQLASLGVKNERAGSGQDGPTRLTRTNSQTRMKTGKTELFCSSDHERLAVIKLQTSLLAICMWWLLQQLMTGFALAAYDPTWTFWHFPPWMGDAQQGLDAFQIFLWTVDTLQLHAARSAWGFYLIGIDYSDMKEKVIFTAICRCLDQACERAESALLLLLHG